MTLNTSENQATPNVPQRRVVEDLPQPYQPLEWDETPFGPSSVVYLYSRRADSIKNWIHIKTEEKLLEVQAASDQYDLWTLFTVPVDDVSRAPRAIVAAAQTRLDQINKLSGAAIANARASVTNITAAMAAFQEQL